MRTRGRPPWFLALDQGGHSTRAHVFAADGEQLAQACAAVGTAQPHPGWVEQDAVELHRSLECVIDDIARQLGRHLEHIRAAGLATQRSNLVCWDRASGAPLAPALSWQDRRNAHWLERIAMQAGLVRARTGLPLSPHYGASKLRWCLDHVEAVARARDAGRLICGPLASFLLARLVTGRPCLVDPANASRTLLWNLDSGDWDPELLSLFGIGRAWLPECVPTCYEYGMMAVGARAVPLRILTGDQAAVPYAEGPPNTSHIYANLGTGAFLQRPFARLPQDADGLLRSVAYCDAARCDYVVEGTVNGAGVALDWARDELGLSDIERQLPHWLRREGEIPVFLNGIAGLGSPWWYGHFPSRFIGPGEPWAQGVAVAESILFMLCENLACMQRLQPGVRALRVSGGLAALDGLCRRLADLSGLPVLRSREREATVRGVAFLLAQAAGKGWRGDSPETFEPAPAAALQRRRQRWQEAMRAATAGAGG